jgi:16S rRNA C1402 (ribose-2'-O) methylase RsmI
MSAKTPVYLIPSPIGDDLTDFSVASLRALKTVTHIFVEHEPRFVERMLEKSVFEARHVIHYLDARDATAAVTLVRARTPIAIMAASGIPCFVDPGHEVIAALWDQCIDDVELTPLGMSSALDAALAMSGLNVAGFLFFGHFPERHQSVSLLGSTTIPIVSYVRGPAVRRFVEEAESRCPNGTKLLAMRDIRKKSRTRMRLHRVGEGYDPASFDDVADSDYVVVLIPPGSR